MAGLIEMSTRLPAVWRSPGRANMLMRRYQAEVERQVAEFGLQLIDFYMRSFFKNETPYYRKQVHVEYTGDPRITDGGVIYGPWLAGEGSRNARSRFKGYSHWRRTAQGVEQAVPDIGDRVWEQTMAGEF